MYIQKINWPHLREFYTEYFVWKDSVWMKRNRRSVKRNQEKARGEEVREKMESFKHLLAACIVPGTARYCRENKLNRKDSASEKYISELHIDQALRTD